ncbi:protein NETWORKED 1D-like isoform X2 [Hordeum vulgare subsp. vulgare]|uniref:protein NETWORKED 1D-like isoform X2 n=1 Tax=Hordeum vulgare subsp. vulgare TaxID=112509 RepID=UPI001D1A363E|nr:protein NETWORKED 1D-like isoform X2 [Hordeum vulgare subsp. vulgare]
MATLVRRDSNNTRYSWLWVSHISPKNSKWLQENLTDMDMMVKAMIKLINEDADSFARRAEMYYKKRPELMKHVEEFYRAYRALAERYDQATGALRQAHRTISEEFPNQMPSMSEDSPSSSQEGEPRTPEMLTPLRAPFEPDDLHRDALGVSPPLFTVKRNTHPDEIGSLSSRKGLKQFTDLFESCDSAHRVSFSDGKVRKGLSFESPDAKGKQDAGDDIMNLQNEISKLLAESQILKQQVSSESQRANNAENECQSLKDTISCLISEKDNALVQYSESTKRLSALETELSKAHNELKKLSDYMAREVGNLNSAESHNNTMQSELEVLGQKIMMQQQELAHNRKDLVDSKSKFESEIHSLRSTISQINTEKDVALLQHQKCVEEVSDLESKLLESQLEQEKIELKVQMLVQELEQKREVADAIHTRLQDEHFNHMQKEAALLAMEDLHSQSQEEVKRLAQDLEDSNKKLSDLEAQHLAAQSETEKIANKAQILERELVCKTEEVSNLQSSLQKEGQKCMLAETTLLRLENLHLQSQEEAKTLAQNLQILSEKLSEAENDRLNLQNISRELKSTISEMDSEKNAMLLQQEQSLERFSYLEAHLCDVQSDLDKNKEKVHLLEQELKHNKEVLDGLHNNLEEEGQKRMHAEAELRVVTNLHSESQEEVSKLVMDLQKLNDELSEVQDSNLIVEDLLCELMNTISVLNTEKDAALLQLQLSLERVTDLKSEVSETQLEAEKTEQKLQVLEQEFAQKNVMVDFLQSSLQDEGKARAEAETLLISKENQYFQSQEEVNRLALENETLNRKLNEMENLSFELKNAILLLNSEKDTTLLQHKQSMVKISDLESKLSVVQVELENAEQKVQMLDKELEQKKEEFDSLQTSLKDEAQKNAEGEAALLTITNLYSSSQEEVNRLALEINKLNRKLNEVENVSSDLKNTILLLNTEKDTALLKQEQFLVRVSDLESKLSEVQAELENSEQKGQVLDDELEQKKEEVYGLQTSLKDEARKNAEGEAAVLTITNLYSNSQEEVNRLAIEINKLNRKLNEVESVSSELKNTILLLNTEKDTALLQHKQSLVRVSDLESKLSEVQAELESSEQKGQMLEKELEQKKEEVDSLQTSLKDEARKNAEGEEALLTITNLYSNSQEEVNRLADEMNKLNRKLNEVESVSSELKNTILVLNTEKDTALLQHKQSLVRVSDLESKLSEVLAELESSEQKGQMLDKELEQKKEEVDSLQTSLKDEARKNAEGEEALLTITNLYSNSQEEVNRLADEMNKLNRKLNEVESVSSELKNTILVLNTEKDTALLQHKQSLVRVSDLESKLSEVLAELESFEQKGQMIDKELKQKREEVDILQTKLKDEAHKHIEAEASLLMMTNMHSQSQEEVSRLILKIERLNDKLNEMENSKLDLESMISKQAEDNRILGEQNLSSELIISGLHSELDVLKEMKVNLENEVGLHIGDKETLQSQLAHQKKDTEILEKQYCSLEHEMKEVNSRAGTLQQLLEEKTCDMEKLSDEYLILKKSFSNATVETEALKEIIEELEASQSSLKHDVCLHSSEKDALARELHILNKKYADISEQQSMLEISFSALLAEKDDILSQLESATLAMKTLEDAHADLGGKNSSLLAEKDLLCSQLENLQDQVQIRNEQHEALLRLHQIQINDFEAIVSSLQEKIRHMDEMLDQELQECTDASISALILNNSLADVKDKNFALFDECQKFIKATHSAEVAISRLKEEAMNEEEEKKVLLKHNKELWEGISEQIKILNVCKDLGRPGVIHDELMLQTLSRETFNHVKHKEESEHRNVFMEAELSVLGTILTEIVIDFRDLHLQKCELEKVVETGAAELLSARSENHKLIELNEQMQQRLQQGSEKEEMLNIELTNGMAQLMQKIDELHKADEKNQFLQEANQELHKVLRDLEASAEDAKGELEEKIAALTEQGDVMDNDYLLLCEANVALQGEVDTHKQKEESLVSTLEMVTKENEQHEREIASLVSDMITCSVNVMIYEEHLLELMMECEALEIRMITEKGMLMKEISSRDAYVDDLHKRIAIMGAETAKLKAEMSRYLPLLASLSDQISMLEEGTHLLSDKKVNLELVQDDRRGSEFLDIPSGVLELDSLIARVEALRVVILDVKDRQDKEFTEFAAKLESANLEIQDLKSRKGSYIGHKEQYVEDDRQKYDADNSKGKQAQIMKDIELDQVSTCPPYGSGAAVYPLGGDANAELDDEMLQLWETAEKDCKNGTAKSSSSEHDIQEVEEVKSQYTSFEIARGRDQGINRLEISTATLEPQQLWTKNVLEKLATDAQGLLIIQASIEEVKQKLEGTSKGKSPMSPEYSSIRAQLQEIEGSVLEQIGFNSGLTKKAENYPAFEVNADLEGYSSRRKISEQVQKGSEKVARLDLELQKIQYVLLKLEEEHEFKRVKVSEKRSRLLLRDYVYSKKDKNDAGQKKKSRVPFCGCVRPKTIAES